MFPCVLYLNLFIIPSKSSLIIERGGVGLFALFSTSAKSPIPTRLPRLEKNPGSPNGGLIPVAFLPVLNILIKDDNSVENYDTLKGSTFENLNREIANLVDSTNPYNISDLYHHIMFDNLNNNLSFDPVVRNNPVLKDVMSVYDVTSKTWVEKNGANGTNFVNYYNLLLPNNNITDYNSFKNKSVLQKFNMLVFSYIEQFYNSSSKKIYVKLFDEFANKTMSSTIFDQGGILDVNESGAIDNVPKNLTFGVVQNDSVLSLTISKLRVPRGIVTRTSLPSSCPTSAMPTGEEMDK